MDGLFSPKQWAKAIKEKGLKAHALTDHGSLAGILPFYYAMKAEDLQPIVGAEFYFTDQPTLKDEANRGSAHLILLAKNEAGWVNLLRLSKLSWSEGFYYKPRIGIDWLTAHSDGLVCLTACLGGVLSREVWKERDGKPGMGLEKRWAQLHAIFGDDLYVEFQGHNSDDQRHVHKQFTERLRPFNYKHVVTNDCHYILPEHAKVQELIKNAAYGKSEAAQSYTAFDSLWLKKPRDVLESFDEHHDLSRRFVVDGMLATEEIAEKCAKFEIPKKRYLPRFSDTEDSVALFRRLTATALAEFLKRPGVLEFATKDEYVDRFKKEYGVITRHGLADYFLIVWDVVRWAKEQGIYVGIGRGSSAGSLIVYLLGIVKLNPLQYKLLFERFVNDNRLENGEPPDIDLDFESDRRDEVKKYVFERYGNDRVCEIGTYGRMMLKTAIIDFGKQFGIQTRELLQITTTLGLDKTEAQSLDAAKDASPRLKSIMRTHPDYESAVRAINGQIKSQSIHPAGVLICAESLDLVTPLKTQKQGTGKNERRSVITQSEDKYVVAQGLLKMDLLGLKEYDICKFVVEHSGGKLKAGTYFDQIHEAELAEPDEKVWELFKAGKTDAVFQFGSDGMKQLLIDMKADCIDDLIAAVALYRPGCLANNWHTRYYKRKAGEEEVELAHESLAETLADTYGVCVYQEQFMETFHRLGGVSLVDADTIRSALGKKDQAKLDKFKKQFVKNAAKKVGSKDKAEEIWDQLAKAAGYTFNRSHSAVYGLVAYTSQWMKVHYTVPFWTAVLDWDTRKKKWDDILSDKRAAAEMGVVPLMPDINRSKTRFVVERIDGSIPELPDEVEGLDYRPRWSLCGVSGIGEKTADEIVANQPFKNFDDFHDRVHKGKVKVNNIEALIYAGAFDSLGDRVEILKALYAKKGKPAPKVTPDLMLREYYRVIGFFEGRLRDVFDGFHANCMSETEVVETMNGEPVLVGGMVSEVASFKTKKGDAMGRITLVDLDERISVTLFPSAWSRYRSLLREGKLLQIAGHKSTYGGRENQLEVGDEGEIEEIGGEDRPVGPYDPDDIEF